MTEIEINRRLHRLPTTPQASTRSRPVALWERQRDRARLASFFVRLAVKERSAPRLHVRPLVAELFLTENCNLRCLSCACWRQTTRNELSTDVWCTIIDQLAELRFLKVNFTGGEPLIRRDSIGLMAYAASRIPQVHLNTNAVLLTETKLDEVLRAGVRSFNISVDGPTPEVHDAIRGREGAFEVTISALRRVVALQQQHGLKIRMNFTVLKDNIEWLPDIAELAGELGVRLYLNLGTDTTFLFRADPVTERVALDAGDVDAALARLESVLRRDSTWLPRYSDVRYMREHFADVVQEGLPCAESQLKLMVHSTGGVGGCWGHDPTMNVRDRSIADIIDADEYRDQHARLFRKDCVGCGSNYSLNLRWRPSTYVSDSLWRHGRRSLTAS